MTSKSIMRRSNKTKTVFQSSSSSSRKAIPARDASHFPVFMIPQHLFEPTSTPKSQTATVSKPTRRHSNKTKTVYRSSSPSARKAIPDRVPARVPVFMLPQNDVSTIPEDSEIHQGFSVNMTLQPHRTRIFSGLMSLSNIDKPAIDQSATTSVQFRSFSCTKTIAILALAA